MPVEEATVLKITCDNPACKGHPDLDERDRTGWLFISSEVYGDLTQQSVFGSVECLNAATKTTTELFVGAPS